MENVMVFIRLHAPPNAPEALIPKSGFIVSSMMAWTDPRLITCLIGLCMAAIDEPDWEGLNIQDLLCPQDERHQIVPDGGDDGENEEGNIIVENDNEDEQPDLLDADLDEMA